MKHVIALTGKDQVLDVEISGDKCHVRHYSVNGNDIQVLDAAEQCDVDQAIRFLSIYLKPVPPEFIEQLHLDCNSLWGSSGKSGVCLWDSSGTLVLDERETRH
jgi:hypothetical protein